MFVCMTFRVTACHTTVDCVETSVVHAVITSSNTKKCFYNGRVGCELTVQTSKIPMYERMWNFMEHKPEVFVDSTPEGLDKVLQSNYAFLLESTMNEYVTQRNCDLIQVGGLLDAKGYGIGTPIGPALYYVIFVEYASVQEVSVMVVDSSCSWCSVRSVLQYSVCTSSPQ